MDKIIEFLNAFQWQPHDDGFVNIEDSDCSDYEYVNVGASDLRLSLIHI